MWDGIAKSLIFIGFMAEREGFEPSIRVNVYTLSRRAPSTARPPLRFPAMHGRANSGRRRLNQIRNWCKYLHAPADCRVSYLSYLLSALQVPLAMTLAELVSVVLQFPTIVILPANSLAAPFIEAVIWVVVDRIAIAPLVEL